MGFWEEIGLAALPAPNWLPEDLQREIDDWNAQLVEVAAKHERLTQKTRELDATAPSFVSGVEGLRKERLKLLQAAIQLLDEGLALAGRLREARAAAKQAARQKVQDVDTKLLEQLRNLGFDVDSPEARQGRLAGALSVLLASHPEAKAAAQRYYEIAEQAPGDLIYTQRLKALRDQARQMIDQAVAAAIGG